MKKEDYDIIDQKKKDVQISFKIQREKRDLLREYYPNVTKLVNRFFDELLLKKLEK